MIYLSNVEKKEKWYDNGHTITNCIIALIIAIIVCTQSFANGGEVSLTLFSSVINHNSIYLMVLIYFVLLKFSFGKRNFNYLNLFLIFVYFIVTLTSFLTVVQSFSLTTLLTFILNFIILVYTSHTLFRDSRIWKEFHISKSPFNEITNIGFFYALIVVSVFLLAVDLISTVVFSGVILSLLDAIYYVLLGRYLYLYREYLDERKLDSNNEGNFDTVREKVQEVLDKTDIDEKIVNVTNDVKDKITGLLDSNEAVQDKEVVIEKEETPSMEEKKKKEDKPVSKKTSSRKSTKKNQKKGEE